VSRFDAIVGVAFPTLLLNYADVLTDPAKAVLDSIEFTGIATSSERAAAFVDSTLCHN